METEEKGEMERGKEGGELEKDGGRHGGIDGWMDG